MFVCVLLLLTAATNANAAESISGNVFVKGTNVHLGFSQVCECMPCVCMREVLEGVAVAMCVLSF